MLAMHRDVWMDAPIPVEWVEGDPVDAPTHHPFGECSLCVMQKELSDSIAAQDTALREYARGMRKDAQDFASELQERAKVYIDSENEQFHAVAKNYIDNQAAALSGVIAANQTTAKTYVDSEVGKVRSEVPTWTNNRLVQVIKTEAFKVDPRL
jgi:hypothetical protein